MMQFYRENVTTLTIETENSSGQTHIHMCNKASKIDNKWCHENTWLQCQTKDHTQIINRQTLLSIVTAKWCKQNYCAQLTGTCILRKTQLTKCIRQYFMQV